MVIASNSACHDPFLLFLLTWTWFPRQYTSFLVALSFVIAAASLGKLRIAEQLSCGEQVRLWGES
jgi:hypothetical protein